MNTLRTCGSRSKVLATTLAVCVGVFLAAAPIAGAVVGKPKLPPAHASWDS